MAQYIDKSAVVAEIDKRVADNKKDIERASHKHLEEYFEGYEDALVLFKEKFLDTLEVRAVDLVEEIANQYEANYKEYLTYEEFADAAKHFFELGLKARKEE